MKIDNEVNASLTYLANKFKDLTDRTQLWPIAQFDTVNRNDLVGEAGEFNDLARSLAGKHGDI